MSVILRESLTVWSREMTPSLRARPGEIVVDKWTFGAFASTDLEAQLRARGVRKILLGGILTNVCVFATAATSAAAHMLFSLPGSSCMLVSGGGDLEEPGGPGARPARGC